MYDEILTELELGDKLTGEEKFAFKYLVESFPEELLRVPSGEINKSAVHLLLLLSKFISKSREQIKGIEASQNLAELYDIINTHVDINDNEAINKISIDSFPELKLLYMLALEHKYEPSNKLSEIEDQIKEILLNRGVVEKLSLAELYRGSTTAIREVVTNIIATKGLTANTNFSIEEGTNSIDLSDLKIPVSLIEKNTLFYENLMRVRPAGTKIELPQIEAILFSCMVDDIICGVFTNLVDMVEGGAFVYEEPTPRPLITEKRAAPIIEPIVDLGKLIAVTVKNPNPQPVEVTFELEYNYNSNEGLPATNYLNYKKDVSVIIAGASIYKTKSEIVAITNDENLEAKVTIKNIVANHTTNSTLNSDRYDYKIDNTLVSFDVAANNNPVLKEVPIYLLSTDNTADGYGKILTVYNPSGYPATQNFTVYNGTSYYATLPNQGAIQPYGTRKYYFYDVSNTGYNPNTTYNISLKGYRKKNNTNIEILNFFDDYEFTSPNKTTVNNIDTTITQNNTNYFNGVELVLKQNTGVLITNAKVELKNPTGSTWNQLGVTISELQNNVSTSSKYYAWPTNKNYKRNASYDLRLVGTFSGVEGSNYSQNVTLKTVSSQLRTTEIETPEIEAKLTPYTYTSQPYGLYTHLIYIRIKNVEIDSSITLHDMQWGNVGYPNMTELYAAYRSINVPPGSWSPYFPVGHIWGPDTALPASVDINGRIQTGAPGHYNLRILLTTINNIDTNKTTEYISSDWYNYFVIESPTLEVKMAGDGSGANPYVPYMNYDLKYKIPLTQFEYTLTCTKVGAGIEDTEIITGTLDVPLDYYQGQYHFDKEYRERKNLHLSGKIRIKVKLNDDSIIPVASYNTISTHTMSSGGGGGTVNDPIRGYPGAFKETGLV